MNTEAHRPLAEDGTPPDDAAPTDSPSSGGAAPRQADGGDASGDDASFAPESGEKPEVLPDEHR